MVRRWGGGKSQRSRRETATWRLWVVKRLDAKLPISRVVLDLVEWFLFLFGVYDLFDGGGQVESRKIIILFSSRL